MTDELNLTLTREVRENVVQLYSVEGLTMTATARRAKLTLFTAKKVLFLAGLIPEPPQPAPSRRPEARQVERLERPRKKPVPPPAARPSTHLPAQPRRHAGAGALVGAALRAVRRVHLQPHAGGGFVSRRHARARRRRGRELDLARRDPRTSGFEPVSAETVAALRTIIMNLKGRGLRSPVGNVGGDRGHAENAVTMRDRWDYAAFPCTKCGAGAGAPCVEPSGRRYTGIYRGGIGHKARGDVAREAWAAAMRLALQEGDDRAASGYDEVTVTDEVWDFEASRPRDGSS